MKFYLPILCFAILIASCSKNGDSSSSNPESDKTRDFSTNTFNVYLNQALFTSRIDYPATDAQWDFGDGSVTQTAKAPSHTYTKGGTYTITMTIGNNKKTHKVRVYPGDGSFQIQSSTSMNIEIPFPSYQLYKAGGDPIGDVYHLTPIKQGVKTDTIYFSRPASLSYDPGLIVYLNFTNPYSRSINFKARFNIVSGVHKVFNITDDLRGDYSYLTTYNYMVTTSGPFRDAVLAN
jgi:hypothetical protein